MVAAQFEDGAQREKFLEADGTLTKEIMPDFLHLSAKGYQIWADSISGKVNELMK